MPRVHTTANPFKVAFRYEPGSAMAKAGAETRVIEVDRDGVDLNDDEAAVALSYENIKLVAGQVVQADAVKALEKADVPTLIEPEPPSLSTFFRGPEQPDTPALEEPLVIEVEDGTQVEVSPFTSEAPSTTSTPESTIPPVDVGG